MLIVITGISGSGKDTLGRYLQEYGVTKLVSYTTRPMRESEQEGVDYHFISKEEYEKLNKANDVQYANNFYSFKKEDITDSVNENKYSVVNVDGLLYFNKMLGKENIVHVHLNVPLEVAVERMRKRGDTSKNIEARIQHYMGVEIHAEKMLMDNADYIVEGSLDDYISFAEMLVSKL